VLALLAGSLVYVFGRDWSSVLFLAPLDHLAPQPGGGFGTAGFSLPALLHSYAISLLLICTICKDGRRRGIPALAWFALAAALELSQLDLFKPLLAEPAGAPVAASLADGLRLYALNGTFDLLDLTATALGCWLAYFIAFIEEKNS
jgi:hypothetical protein